LNSIESILWNLERPLMFAGLVSLQKRLGKEKFPLIIQHYFPNFRQMRFTPEYPIVIKVGHVHSGYGKMMLSSQENFQDLASVLSLHNDYCTAEKFIKGEYDLRIQKIGNNYRAYKRIGCSGWKTNVGSSFLEDIPMTEQYKLWADECSKLFGGMDILAVDAIHNSEDGKDYILELNDSSIGLGPQHEEEDMLIIRDLTIEKMSEAFSRKLIIPREKIDSTSLYKKLEVELINSRNSRLEKEKDLQISKSKIDELILANQAWKNHTKKYFKQIIGASLFVGFVLGYFGARFFLKCNSMSRTDFYVSSGPIKRMISFWL